MRAYRFALDPTPRQERDLARHAGAARVAFNWGLAAVRANLEQRAAERSYGIEDRDLTPAIGWSLPALRRLWNRAKVEAAPWWSECSKEAFNTGLDQLARALKNWSSSRAGVRAGRPIGFPRFKSRRNAVPSVRFTTGAIRLEADRRHVRLPRLGVIKTHESTLKLERKLTSGNARILAATCRFEQGRWFVAFTVEATPGPRSPRRPAAVIGVDLGVTHLAVCSDGTMVENPRCYEAARRRLARASRTVSRRQGPDRRTGRQASNRWLRANNARNKIHHRVANQRRDGIHKLTTALTREYGTVVVEDLHVAGMVRNRRLARKIQDVGFGEIRRQLAYKAQWNGGRLVVADRWYPSSKACSRCGTVKPKLSLAQRTYTCGDCGLVLDRDHNAAINLANLVKHAVAGSGPETLNGRGADRKTARSVAGGRETSTPHPAHAGISRGPAPGNERILQIQ
jgi:putative transposase